MLTLISTFTFGQAENTIPMSNRDLVKTALTEVFVKGNINAIDRYWSEKYIQHNPHVDNGRDALKKIFASGTKMQYEMGLITTDGDFVMVHARITGFGPKPMIGVDIFRVINGQLTEHWDVLQEEVPADKTVSGNPMFPIK
jgi:predicted SnoaL-like aldol condensation-catalyzing enzyme